MFTRTFDEESGILRITVFGGFTVAELDEHFDALRQMIAALRQRGTSIRALVDIRAMLDPSPAMEAIIGAQKERTYIAGDRVSILTKDSGGKNHLRTLLSGAEIWCWESELVAEQWLYLPGTVARSPDIFVVAHDAAVERSSAHPAP